MAYERLSSIGELRRANRALQIELQAVRARLQEATLQSDLARKTARDAWDFAKTALRTGRTTQET